MILGEYALRLARMVRAHNSLCRHLGNNHFYGALITATLVTFFLGLEDFDELLIVVIKVALKPIPVD